MDGWRECRREPCPVCGHKGWCGVSSDGAVCHCMRVPSDHVCASGGWMHFLVERPRREPVRMAPRRPVRPMLDMGVTMRGFREEFERGRGGADGDVFDSLLEIAAELRLPAASLDRLGVGRSAHYLAWAFPMRDADARVVGIRLRRYGTRDKFSVSGSRDGLFYDPDVEPAETVADGVRGRELVVCEGATDCAAGYALGLPCVGRSSCGTGADALRGLCGRLGVRRVTIVTDYDEPKRRPDGSYYQPGIDGARALGRALGRCWRIVTPVGAKDLRDWYYSGLTTDAFWRVAGMQRWSV